MNRATRAASARLTVLSAILLAAATTGAQTGQPQPNPGQSSIALHGFWTIEIHESDGRLVNRYQFHNALNDQRALLFILARQRLGRPLGRYPWRSIQCRAALRERNGVCAA